MSEMAAKDGSDLDRSTDDEGPADDSTAIEGWNHGGQRASTSVESPGVPDRLSRAWDVYDAYLFDIDGTLVHCRDAVHYFAFCDVLTAMAGRPVRLDGVPVQGRIDPGILADALHRADVREEAWRPRMPELLDRMGRHAEAHAAEFDMEVLPGVRAVLEHLHGRGRLLGVGTGNLQRIGWAKMQAAGLRDFFSFGAFSDAYTERGPMIAGGVAAARAALGNANAAVLVVGDTPGDIAAARFAGVEVLAVATGIFAEAELMEADRLVPSLAALLESQL